MLFFCRCFKVEMYQPDINGKQPKENIKAGVANYLNKITDKQREHLLGIQGNKAYNNGESLEHCLRGWQGVVKQKSRLRKIDLRNMANGGRKSKFIKLTKMKKIL